MFFFFAVFPAVVLGVLSHVQFTLRRVSSFLPPCGRSWFESFFFFSRHVSLLRPWTVFVVCLFVCLFVRLFVVTFFFVCREQEVHSVDALYCFEVFSANRRSYMLQAEGPDELKSWVISIRRTIESQAN